MMVESIWCMPDQWQPSCRIATSPMCVLVMFLVAISWFAYVFETPGVTVIELVMFHVWLIMLVVSHLQ